MGFFVPGWGKSVFRFRFWPRSIGHYRETPKDEERRPRPFTSLAFVPNTWLKRDLGTLAIPVHPLWSWQDLGGSAGEGAPAAGPCQPLGEEVLAGQGILGLSLRWGCLGSTSWALEESECPGQLARVGTWGRNAGNWKLAWLLRPKELALWRPRRLQDPAAQLLPRQGLPLLPVLPASAIRVCHPFPSVSWPLGLDPVVCQFSSLLSLESDHCNKNDSSRIPSAYSHHLSRDFCVPDTPGALFIISLSVLVCEHTQQLCFMRVFWSTFFVYVSMQCLLCAWDCSKCASWDRCCYCPHVPDKILRHRAVHSHGELWFQLQRSGSEPRLSCRQARTVSLWKSSMGWHFRRQVPIRVWCFNCVLWAKPKLRVLEDASVWDLLSESHSPWVKRMGASFPVWKCNSLSHRGIALLQSRWGESPPVAS